MPNNGTSHLHLILPTSVYERYLTAKATRRIDGPVICAYTRYTFMRMLENAGVILPSDYLASGLEGRVMSHLLTPNTIDPAIIQNLLQNTQVKAKPSEPTDSSQVPSSNGDE